MSKLKFKDLKMKVWDEYVLCQICGGLVSGDPGFPVHDCVHKPISKAETHLFGWECPRCHRIHSPFVSECYCYPNVQTLINPQIKEETK